MNYRTLGRSGLKVSAIGLGTGSATFAGRADDLTAVQIIRRAFDLGITYFDTGETYAEGRAESLLGTALKQNRSDVVIATKFGKDRSVGPNEHPGSRSRLIKAVDGSLKRLGTDYIDLYIMHEPDPATPILETLRGLNDLVRAGKVRYIGCSDFAAWQLSEAQWTSRQHGLEAFITAGGWYNLLDRRIERELVPCSAVHGVGIVPAMPLAGGFLTGKYRDPAVIPEGARFSSVPEFSSGKFHDLKRYRPFLVDVNFRHLAALEGFAQSRGHTVNELAVAWLLSRPWVGAVPIGATSADQVASNIAGAAWSLSNEDLAELDRIGDVVRRDCEAVEGG